MSNLLQKASIITTPTAYDTGKILSVKPVQTYGPELVTNGDFATDSDWTKGSSWSISGGTANSNGGTASTLSSTPLPSLVVGKTYKTTYTITNRLSGSTGINATTSFYGSNNTDVYHSEVATYVVVAKCASASGDIRFYSNGFNGSIDNVSVKEVLNADFDFTRNSSATRVGSNGLIQDVASNLPRIDYTGGVGSWKFEPQRTNTITYSENFSQYLLSDIVSIQSGFLAPDGTNTAYKITGTIGISSIYMPSVSSTTASRSIWARTVSGTGTSSLMSYFNNTNNLFTITEEWQRFELTSSSSTGGTNFYPIDFRDSTQTLSEIIIWGAQSESGSFPTSYIRSNTGSATTRLADLANNAGSSDLINSTEGVLMAETKGENDGTFNYISLNDGNTTNYCGILYTDNDNEITYRYYVGGSGVQIIISGIDVTNFNKIAVKWKVNDFAIWINGYELGTSSSGSLNPSGTFNQLAFARGGSNNTPFYGNTKSVAVFKEALTDLELECLVSWMSFSDLGINFGYTVE